jgi:hypothetical protein
MKREKIKMTKADMVSEQKLLRNALRQEALND